ncbi:hypothetical protein KCV01_g12060, partial [Aureobasidium melanogenum]
MAGIPVDVLDTRGGSDPAASFGILANACLRRVQAMLGARPSGDVLLQIVLPEGETESMQAGMAGLLRTANRENPRFRGQIVFVRGEATGAAIAQQLEQAQAHADETVLRFERGTQAMGIRWRRAPSTIMPSPYREHGTYLITGGLGGLGRIFARDILTGTRHARVILTGRLAASGEREPHLSALQALGGDRVVYRALDLDDISQVRGLVDDCTRQGHRLCGILHAAGMTADGFILKKSQEELGRVLAPKVGGTWQLDRATRDVDLDFFVLFSSVASVFGNVGQADYASANGFMDEFAVWRQKQVARGDRQGLTLSIAWPLWAEGGMRLPDAHDASIVSATGTPLSTPHGLRAFRVALASSSPRCVVLDSEGQALGSLLEGAMPAVTSGHASAGKTQGDPARWLGKARDVLRRLFSTALKIESSRLG